MKIQTTLLEPANDTYTCTVDTTRMQYRYAQVQVIKRHAEVIKRLIKGCGSRFHCESSSLNARYKDSQSKWLPRPLIGESFNHSHSHVAMLHSSGTVCGSKIISGESSSAKLFCCCQFCNNGFLPNFFTIQ